MNTEEKSPFLESNRGNRTTHGDREGHITRASDRTFIASAALNVALLIICVLLSGTLLRMSSVQKERMSLKSSTSRELPEPYSPANAAIEYEYRSVTWNDTRFRGYPGSEWEHSWHELLNGTLLKVSEEEIKLLGSDSIPLEGGGYAGGLGVAHNLHCVKKIKKYLYREYFYPDMEPDGDEMARTRDHADHCLDWLRQGVMCHADALMYTLWWENPISPTHKIPGLQKCVNWEKLHGWMKARAASKDMLLPPET